MQVGRGEYGSIHLRGLFQKDRLTLLKAIRHDEAFENTLINVALDECKVSVGTTTKNEPEGYEFARAKQLIGDQVVGDVVGKVDDNTKVFIGITLPRLPGKFCKLNL